MASDRQRVWANGGHHPLNWNRPKLTAQQRAEICRRLAAGERTADLAAEYGVNRSTINSLR
jgi:DNA-binding CsgD family transcriptional regulator